MDVKSFQNGDFLVNLTNEEKEKIHEHAQELYDLFFKQLENGSTMGFSILSVSVFMSLVVKQFKVIMEESHPDTKGVYSDSDWFDFLVSTTRSFLLNSKDDKGSYLVEI